MHSLISLVARRWWLLLLRGLVAIAFGISALAWPGPTAAALMLLLGAYLLADGVVGSADYWRHRGQLQDGWLWLFDAILSLAAGLAIVFMPGMTAVVLVLLMGAWAIAAGLLRIALAIRLRQIIANEWWLALSGLLSLALGVLLVLQPGAGLVSLIWLIGIWALLLGGLFVALALRLRGYIQRF